MNKGLKFVGGDTDGLKFCKPDMSPISDEELKELTDEINALLPEMLVLEPDGYFEEITILKTKNYITKEDGKVKLKGSSITDQKKELAMLEMVREIANSVLGKIDYTELQEIYMKYVKEACNITDPKRWSKKMTLTKAILNAETDPAARANEKKPWDAIKDKNLQEGDKFWVYPVKGEDIQKKVKGELQFYKDGRPKMKENIILKTADDYDSDEHIPKLLKRCYDTISIFKTILEMDKFLDYSKLKNYKMLEGK